MDTHQVSKQIKRDQKFLGSLGRDTEWYPEIILESETPQKFDIKQKIWCG